MVTRSPDYLQAAADRAMIADTLGRYAWEIDHGTPEAFAAVFTDAGVFEAPQSGLRVEGREALTAFARDLQSTLPNVHHVMSNLSIEVSGDRARSRCELNEFMARPEQIYANLHGWYEDELLFDGQRWRIDHRRVFVPELGPSVTGKVGEYFAPYFKACEKYQRQRCATGADPTVNVGDRGPCSA